MNSDLLLVIGIVLAAFSIPSLLSAYSESRPPRVAAVVVVGALALVAWALSTSPGGYSFAEIPKAFVRVIGSVLN